MNPLFKYWLWVVSITIWATLCFVVPDFIDNPIDGWQGIVTQLAYITACGIGNMFVLYLIGCNKYVCATILPIYGIIGAAVAFYRAVFHVTITPMIIEVTLHTNVEEAMGVISWQIIAWVLLNAGISVGFCYVRFKHIRIEREWIHALIVLLLGTCYLMYNSRLNRSLRQRYPFNLVYNLKDYQMLQRIVSEERIIPKYNLIDVPDSVTIVLVIGEAVRADHLQLNGYDRETTPRLVQRNNLISLPYIYSEQTHTLASLPYILTRADSVHDEYQYTETSFVPIFRNEEFRTSWISNQDLGETFAHFLLECDTSIFANAGKSTYVFSPWVDEELLPILDQLEQKKHARNLYILHTIGSHWYYNNHVPPDYYYFQPVTTNRLITNNSIEQIVNSYDNTIRYLDCFLDSVITRFENQTAIIIYQSDHSEALGENGEYLHANETEQAKHPACVIWYSEKYAQLFSKKIQALHTNQHNRYRTDYLFYSILETVGIKASGENASVNIFCENP